MTLEQIFQKWQSLQPLSELAEQIGINRSAMQKLLKSMSDKEMEIAGGQSPFVLCRGGERVWDM